MWQVHREMASVVFRQDFSTSAVLTLESGWQTRQPALWGVLWFRKHSATSLEKWKSLSRVRLFATPWTITVHRILQDRIPERVAFPFSRDLPNPGIKPRSPALQVDSLPAEPPGKPKNTGVGSPSLLHGIFLTQELNRGLPHCRRILYQLSYEGNPRPRPIWW